MNSYEELKFTLKIIHVLLIKEHRDWKILMDYDSNEGKTIGEADFNKAYDINDFEKFVKQ